MKTSLDRKLEQLEIEPLLKVSDVRDYIRRYRILVSVPTNQTIINWIEARKLIGFKYSNRTYLVAESSFLKWVQDIQSNIQSEIAGELE